MIKRLKDIWRLKRGEAVWLVGAGGKTGTLNRLARDFSYHQLVYTSTTALLRPAGLPHRLAICSGRAEFFTALTSYRRRQKTEILVPAVRKISRWPGDKKKAKIKGLPVEWIISAVQRFPELIFLVEADGAGNRSCKAPAEWEPVLPANPEVLLLVQGLSGAGKPISSRICHRAGIISSGTGRRYLNLKVYRELFTDRQWYGEHLEAAGRAYLLLSQASRNRQELAAGLVSELLKDIERKENSCFSSVKGITAIDYRNVLEWLYHLEIRKDGCRWLKLNFRSKRISAPGW